MKAKFIRHNDPRKTLGISPALKRDFINREEFVDWMYRYLVPDFYGIPNGPELEAKVRSKLRGTTNYIPQDFFVYVRDFIIPEINIKIGISGWVQGLRSRFGLGYDKDGNVINEY